MAKPQMITTIQRMLNEKEQNQIADKQAQQIIQVATKSSGMEITPAQKITLDSYANAQHQVQMRSAVNKSIKKILQERYYTPALVLREQRAQLALQEDQIKTQIKAKQKEQEYALLAPKETVQNSESADYVSPEQLALLEQAYAGFSMKKKLNIAKLAPMLQYHTNMQDYPGGFVDPNYDKQMRPLGKDTNNITEF